MRKIVLFGHFGWPEAMEKNVRQLDLPADLMLCQSVEGIQASESDELVVLLEESVEMNPALYQFLVQRKSPWLLVCNVSFSVVVNAVQFCLETDTLAELGETLQSEGRSSIQIYTG